MTRQISRRYSISVHPLTPLLQYTRIYRVDLRGRIRNEIAAVTRDMLFVPSLPRDLVDLRGWIRNEIAAVTRDMLFVPSLPRDLVDLRGWIRNEIAAVTRDILERV
ncbi:hypothetical protein TNCV_2510921 [Trichonephila clavipes]|nr:hypothetical protein TNCV_2510921 [Trichonephila clavipes]